MESVLGVGFCDGKDSQGVQRDIPTITTVYIDVQGKKITVLNVIQGNRAKELYKELTNLN